MRHGYECCWDTMRWLQGAFIKPQHEPDDNSPRGKCSSPAAFYIETLFDTWTVCVKHSKVLWKRTWPKSKEQREERREMRWKRIPKGGL